MLIPIVAIQVDQPPEASQWVEHMVAACTSGVSPGRCVDANDAEAAQAKHLAYVSWLDEGRQHALVEVGTGNQPRGRWRFQRLLFAPEDPQLDRWRAIGLTVATLVGPPEAPRAEESAAEAPHEPALAPPPPEQAKTAHPLWVAVRGALGTGFDGGAAAPGVDLRVAYSLESVPVFSTVTAGWRGASYGSVVGSWWDLAVGLGGYLEASDVRFSLAGLLVAETLRASVDDSSGGEDRGSSSMPGAALHLEMCWPSDGRVGFTLGGRGLWLRRPTVVSVANQDAAESPQQGYLGYLGVEARF